MTFSPPRIRPQTVLFPSALSTLIAKQSLPSSPTYFTPHSEYTHALSLNVLHDLKHQHDWTDLQIHTQASHILISGIPPSRIYIHPDEQVEILAAEKEEAATASASAASSASSTSTTPAPSAIHATPATLTNTFSNLAKAKPGSTVLVSTAATKPEREWVLPTHITEKWSLRKFAGAFSSIKALSRAPDPDPRPQSSERPERPTKGEKGIVSEAYDGTDLKDGSEPGSNPRPQPITPSKLSAKGGKSIKSDIPGLPIPWDYTREEGLTNSKRQADAKESVRVKAEKGGSGKGGRGATRLLLAIVSQDGTVVYYVMHDGVVKPRQN